MTRVLDMEPHVDTTFKEFFEAVEQRFVRGGNAGKSLDFGDWCPYGMPDHNSM